jgi:hypothetical protein
MLVVPALPHTVPVHYHHARRCPSRPAHSPVGPAKLAIHTSAGGIPVWAWWPERRDGAPYTALATGT